MPNWCCQNVAIKGDRKELQDFADVINSLSNREDTHPNGFGKYWLGNLVIALGGDWKIIPCRGTVDAYGECCACFFGPDATEERASIGGDGFLRISITTAWGPEPDLYRFILSKYPSFEFGYSATDEFGNFHHRWEPDPEMEICKYVFDGNAYAAGDRGRLLQDIRERLDIDIDAGSTDKDLKQTVWSWAERQEAAEDRYLVFQIYKDVELF